MDGLASTAGICTAFSISMLAWFTGHVACAPLAMALAGSLLGFLYFNRPPASIYLGDAGSMVIGLVVAALALRSATTTDGEVAIIPLVAVLGLPLLDMALAVSRRWLSGIGISQPDRLHVHHRLLEAGFRIPQILAMIAGLCLVLGALAISAAATQLDWVAIIGSLAIVAAMLRMRLIGHHEWRLAGDWLRMRIATSADPATPSIAEPLRIFGPSIGRETAKELPADDRRAA
jgi:UDP-GlcNAc:undecaprenyl-phosphate GlcNAc-1-phosphate transferase